MKNRKVLITGGAGFIGSKVAYGLLRFGCEIIILDNFSPQIHGSKNKLLFEGVENIRIVNSDVTNKPILYETLSQVTDVIHLAAETGTGQSMYNISKYVDVNIQSTALICDFLVNSKHSIQTFVVASSRSIYGEGKYFSDKFGAIYPNSRSLNDMSLSFDCINDYDRSDFIYPVATDENSKLHPSSIYGITKLVQEQLVLLTSKMVGINGFALRYQNVYGPGQSLKNPYTGILSIFTKLALNHKEINVFEDGLESRDFVFVDDVVDATIACLNIEIKDKIQVALNIGTGKSISVLKVAQDIIRLTNSNSCINISGTFREGDIRHNYADISLASEILNYSPKFNFDAGLEKFIEWVYKNIEDFEDESTSYESSILELKNKGLLHER